MAMVGERVEECSREIIGGKVRERLRNKSSEDGRCRKIDFLRYCQDPGEWQCHYQEIFFSR